MLDFQSYNFQVLDWKINTIITGNGSLILFHHGIGLSWQWWQPTLTALSDGFSVCAIDLPVMGPDSSKSALRSFALGV